MKKFNHVYPVIGNYWLGWKSEVFAFSLSLIIAIVIGYIIYYYRGY